MTKFKIGDRVFNLVEDGSLLIGDTGTVMELSTIPYVMWDRVITFGYNSDVIYAQFEKEMELINVEEGGNN